MKNDSKRPSKFPIWEILTILFALSGIVLGFVGFQQPLEFSSPFFYQLYETVRMFLLNRQVEPDQINVYILLSSWLIFIAFLIFTFRLFLKVLAPRALDRFVIRYSYKNHIVVCGLNELSMSFIEKCKEKKIVVITGNKNNVYHESLRQRNIKIIEGDANDLQVLKLAKIKEAAKVYILKSDDKTNVEIAYKVYTELMKVKRKSKYPLKCFVLIKDLELKRVLHDSLLFKGTGKNAKEVFVFDAILFNIAETGVHYGLIQHIDILFNNYTPDSSPEILIIGLGKEAVHVIMSLAHGLTSRGKALSFTILEENPEKIDLYSYKYLHQFAGFKFIKKDFRKLSGDEFNTEVGSVDMFSSIFICYDDKLENLKQAFSFTRKIKHKHPPVIICCDSPESFGEIMCILDTGNNSFAKENNIHIINTFEETFDYLFELDKNIEDCAILTHQKWNEISKDNTIFDMQPEHFKQSNRNQVLDSFYKMFLVKEIKLSNCRLSPQPFVFDEKEKEWMAQMEHRRWAIEKYAYGWTYSEKRDNHLLKHPDLVEWDVLSDEAKEKDRIPILLMEEYIKYKTDETKK